MYHLSLFHFLNKNFDNTFVINPPITNGNKNVDIRKVKNDKKDALSIAKLGKFQNIKLSQGVSLDIFLLKSLIREYYKLTDTCSIFKKKLSTDLRVIFPNYSTVFSSVTSNSSIAILSDYPTPQSILDAPKDKILEILISKSKKGLSRFDKVLLNIKNNSDFISNVKSLLLNFAFIFITSIFTIFYLLLVLLLYLFLLFLLSYVLTRGLYLFIKGL